MTKEEAISLIGWLKCTTNREDDLEAIDMAIEALSADTVSREEYEEVKAYMDTLVDAFIEDGEELAESVKVVRCKDCRYFELDHFDRIDDMPLITAHEVCTKWSGGSKTSKDGFCFMGERREE